MGRLLRLIAVCAALGAGVAGCAPDDSCPSFAHIVSADFGRTGDTLWWTLGVQEIPAALTFNQSAVPANFLEYRWAIDLDSNRDGAVDLRLAIQHFATANGAPVTTGDILSETSQDLLQVMGGVANTVGTFDASIDPTANTFRFQTTTGAAAGLANVSDRSQSTWRTTYRSGADVEDQCDEQYP